MRIQRLVATAAVLAAGLGGAIVTAPTATAASGPARTVTQADVTPKSCPPNAPPPDSGPQFRCLSWYPTEAECNAGVRDNVEHTPSIGGYCQRAPDGWWGFVHPGP